MFYTSSFTLLDILLRVTPLMLDFHTTSFYIVSTNFLYSTRFGSCSLVVLYAWIFFWTLFFFFHGGKFRQYVLYVTGISYYFHVLSLLSLRYLPQWLGPISSYWQLWAYLTCLWSMFMIHQLFCAKCIHFTVVWILLLYGNLWAKSYLKFLFVLLKLTNVLLGT